MAIQQSIKRTAIYHRDYHMKGIDDFINVKVSNVRPRRKAFRYPVSNGLGFTLGLSGF